MGHRELLRGPILMLLYLSNNGQGGVNSELGRGRDRLSITRWLLLLFSGRSVLAALVRVLTPLFRPWSGAA